MHLLTPEQLDKVDSLLSALREAAQQLLEMPSHKSVHTVAAVCEILEELFHVEHRQNQPPTTGSGSPSSTNGVMNAPTEGGRSDRYDHVREHLEGQRTPVLAPQVPRTERPGWARTFEAQRQAQRRPSPPRGRFRGRAKRRR